MNALFLFLKYLLRQIMIQIAGEMLFFMIGYKHEKYDLFDNTQPEPRVNY